MTQRPNWFIGFPFDGPIVVGAPPPKVRLFSRTDLHVTSVFLGAVDERVAQNAWARLVDRAESMLPVDLGEVRLLGGRTPSAISAVVTDARMLAERIDAHRARLVDAGLTRPDMRPPLPHVTFARIQRSATDAQRAAAAEWARTLSVKSSATIDRVALYTWSEDRSRRLFDIRDEYPLNS